MKTDTGLGGKLLSSSLQKGSSDKSFRTKKVSACPETSVNVHTIHASSLSSPYHLYRYRNSFLAPFFQSMELTSATDIKHPSLKEKKKHSNQFALFFKWQSPSDQTSYSSEILFGQSVLFLFVFFFRNKLIFILLML